MADKLRVDPAALSHAANEVANHGEDLLARQQSCHGKAAGAHSGWVGSSAGALSNLLDGWETASDAHLRRFGKHSTDMHFVAADFADTEDRNTEAVRRVGEAVSGESPRL
jgi:WXG100 family type VII secretion target